jgi:hypothetical protein
LGAHFGPQSQSRLQPQQSLLLPSSKTHVAHFSAKSTADQVFRGGGDFRISGGRAGKMSA